MKSEQKGMLFSEVCVFHLRHILDNDILMYSQRRSEKKEFALMMSRFREPIIVDFFVLIIIDWNFIYM